MKLDVVLFDTCSLMMTLCGSKHVGILGVIMQYKYLRRIIVHFVGSVLWILTMHGTKTSTWSLGFPRLEVKNLGSLCPLGIDLYDLVVKTELTRFTVVLRFATENCLSYWGKNIDCGLWEWGAELLTGRPFAGRRIHLQQHNEQFHVLCFPPCGIRMLRRDWRVTCHASGRGEMHSGLWLEDGKAIGHFECWGIDGGIKLKWILKELNGNAWTDLLLFWAGCISGLLWTRQWKFCFREVWEISWLAEELCWGSQGGPPSMTVVELWRIGLEMGMEVKGGV
jgi:hypothetical protein